MWVNSYPREWLNKIPVSSLTPWELKSLKVRLGWPYKPGNCMLNIHKKVRIWIYLYSVDTPKTSDRKTAQMLTEHFDKYTAVYFSNKDQLCFHTYFVFQKRTFKNLATVKPRQGRGYTLILLLLPSLLSLPYPFCCLESIPVSLSSFLCAIISVDKSLWTGPVQSHYWRCY